MAETSGFFEAVQDPETGEYDLVYFASQFASYFSLFIGNGVFGSPTNQLKVNADVGLRVKVSPGWAFINGYWYHNNNDLIIPVPSNTTSEARVDSVRLRWNNSQRNISIVYVVGNVENIRDGVFYDLKLAEVIVPAASTRILDSNISDMRTNENVCGLVTELLEVQTTADLFAQYQAIFEQWFADVKGQVAGDLGIRLQLEFSELNKKVDTYQQNTENIVKDYKDEVSAIAQNAYNTIDTFVANDFVLPKQTLTFSNKKCVINDSRVTANSLIDVYFTAESFAEAEDCQIYVDSAKGQIILTAGKQPTATIQALMRVRVS